MIGLLGLAAMAGVYLFMLHPKIGAAPEQDVSLARVWEAMLAEVPLDEFDRVERGPLQFPRDHGAHPAAPMETWNLSAHLEGESGEDLGFQFSLARLSLVAPGAEPANSPWELREVYRGHAILATGDGTVIAEERLRRGLAGLAGYDAPSREWRLDNWSFGARDGSGDRVLTIAATIGANAAVELRLEPEKSVVSPDRDNSGGQPFEGYSVARLSARGVMVSTQGREIVKGSAWLDHLWGDLPLPAGPTVWDRLLLQTDDGTDISVVRTRRRDGGGTPTLAGFIVGPTGDVSRIDGATATLEPLRRWGPPGAPRAYPVGWRLILDGEREIVVSPLVDNQLHDFVVPLWSGTVTARGDLGAGPVEGIGTLQLNGYAAP